MMTRAFILLALTLPCFAAIHPAAANEPTLVPQASPAGSGDTHDDIRDIRPPIVLPVPTQWVSWLALGGGALAVGAAGFLLLRRRRRLALSLTDRTLARLDAARAHAETGDAYAFAIHVSEISRRYLEERFGLRATHQTTPEFLHDLASQELRELEGKDDALQAFLEACDAAKYARYELGRGRMDTMVEDARRFVEGTRPLPTRGRKSGRASAGPEHPLATAPEGGAA